MVLIIGRWFCVLLFLSSSSRVLIKNDTDDNYVPASPVIGYATELMAVEHGADIIGVYAYRPVPSAEPQLWWFGAANGVWYEPFPPAQGLTLAQPHVTIVGDSIRICGYRMGLYGKQALCWQQIGDAWTNEVLSVAARLFVPLLTTE